jgi:chromosome segregation ATPase
MMDIKEAVRAGLQELILPELNRLKDDNLQLRTILDLTNKRLDDVNAHIVDQSRRIDVLRTELKEEIHAVRTELKEEIHGLSLRMDSMNNRLDNQSDRMDRMTEAMVRRDEQERLIVRVSTLEHRFEKMEQVKAA